MSGVWVFKNGVVRLVENPGGVPGGGRRKALVHVPSGDMITSYDVLERRLQELGWVRFLGNPELLQFHKHSSVHLISVPKDFTLFNSVHMYDVAVKTRNVFLVRDV